VRREFGKPYGSNAQALSANWVDTYIPIRGLVHSPSPRCTSEKSDAGARIFRLQDTTAKFDPMKVSCAVLVPSAKGPCQDCGGRNSLLGIYEQMSGYETGVAWLVPFNTQGKWVSRAILEELP
jgi:hypothetical protein